MKKWIFIILILAAAAYLARGCFNPENDRQRVTITGAWALYPLVSKWADHFGRLDSSVSIGLSAGGAGKGMTDALSGMADLGMVSRAIHPEEEARGAFYIAVAEDAVIPTVSASNPFLKELHAKGVTQAQLRALYLDGSLKNWSELVGADTSAEVQVYSRSDACGAKETFAAFLGGGPDDFKTAIGIFGDPAIADEVTKNPYAVGYNNIGFFFDPRDGKPHEGLTALKVDFNGNGKIDPEEDCYASASEFAKAVSEGRFPRPPARELYLVSKGKPAPHVLAFLRWILTEGQKEAAAAGYIALQPERAAEMIRKLEGI